MPNDNDTLDTVDALRAKQQTCADLETWLWLDSKIMLLNRVAKLDTSYLNPSARSAILTPQGAKRMVTVTCIIILTPGAISLMLIS